MAEEKENKTGLIILGGLAVVGVIYYFWFRHQCPVGMMWDPVQNKCVPLVPPPVPPPEEVSADITQFSLTV